MSFWTNSDIIVTSDKMEEGLSYFNTNFKLFFLSSHSIFFYSKGFNDKFIFDNKIKENKRLELRVTLGII